MSNPLFEMGTERMSFSQELCTVWLLLCTGIGAFLLRSSIWIVWHTSYQGKSQSMTEEQKTELKKRMKGFDEAAMVPDTHDYREIYSRPDFVIKKGWVHIDDPCPCGSGKRLRDCHLDEIRASEQKNGDEAES